MNTGHTLLHTVFRLPWWSMRRWRPKWIRQKRVPWRIRRLQGGQGTVDRAENRAGAGRKNWRPWWWSSGGAAAESATSDEEVCAAQTNKMIVAITWSSNDRGSTFRTTEAGTARLGNSGTTEAKSAGLETYVATGLGSAGTPRLGSTGSTGVRGLGPSGLGLLG